MTTRFVAVAPAVLVSVFCVSWLLAAPAAAQSESALKSYFEGKRVVLKIDLPGTSDGVDVRADSSRPLDYQQYGNRLRTYGTAVRAGDSATVTLIKLKKDLIEVQLSGGGFGTFSDDTSTSVSIPLIEKSTREKELEKLVPAEQDSRRKRDLQRELSELRDRRERDNRRIEADRVRAEEAKKERIAGQRLRGGSRFNIRYAGSVPSGISPEEVMAALEEFVDFAGYGFPEPAADDSLRKGMLRPDVEELFASEPQVSERREGNLVVTTLVFVDGDQRVTAEFVEDVLVRYTIASR